MRQTYIALCLKKIFINWHFHNSRFLRIDLFAKQPDITSPWSAATHFFCSAARTLSPPASNFAPWRRIISLFRGRLSSLGLVSKTSILKLWLKSDFRFHATKFYDNYVKNVNGLCQPWASTRQDWVGQSGWAAVDGARTCLRRNFRPLPLPPLLPPSPLSTQAHLTISVIHRTHADEGERGKGLLLG